MSTEIMMYFLFQSGLWAEIRSPEALIGLKLYVFQRKIEVVLPIHCIDVKNQKLHKVPDLKVAKISKRRAYATWLRD